MIDICRINLEKHNITEGADFHPSLGFISLYLQKKFHDISDYFTNLCLEIINNSILFNKFAIMNDSIIYPMSVQELYTFAQNVYKLTQFDYINPDYETSFKYTVDSLINGYHINFSISDIKKYAYNISRLAYEKVAKYNG